ncbi:MAG TPA: hypothetical protein VEF07_03820 [Candidatus Binataceae bacterium]|nr:hypothetical protein [Candidatus Binataceae bacterium]
MRGDKGSQPLRFRPHRAYKRPSAEAENGNSRSNAKETWGSSEGQSVTAATGTKSILLTEVIPPQLWNKVGIRLIPKLRSNLQPTLGANFILEIDSAKAANLIREIQQALGDLELTGTIKVEVR